jgi:hypothetical protein
MTVKTKVVVAAVAAVLVFPNFGVGADTSGSRWRLYDIDRTGDGREDPGMHFVDAHSVRTDRDGYRHVMIATVTQRDLLDLIHILENPPDSVRSVIQQRLRDYRRLLPGDEPPTKNLVGAEVLIEQELVAPTYTLLAAIDCKHASSHLEHAFVKSHGNTYQELQLPPSPWSHMSAEEIPLLAVACTRIE